MRPESFKIIGFSIIGIGLLIVLACSGISLTPLDTDGIGPYQMTAIIFGAMLVLIGSVISVQSNKSAISKIYLIPSTLLYSLTDHMRYFSKKLLSIENILFLVVLAIGITNLLAGESIQLNNGLGWDGVIYGNVVKEFETILRTGVIPYAPKGLDAYYYQRIFPCGLVYLIIKAGHLSFDYPNIVFIFKIVNLLALLLSTFLWGKITNQLKMSNIGKWLAFIFLFGNFWMLKQYFYYPVLTDQLSFLLSIVMLYIYLKKKRDWLLLISLIGAFTYPLIAVCAVILFAFENSKGIKLEKEIIARKLIILSYIFAILVSLSAVVYMIYTYYYKNIKFLYGGVDYIHSVVPLSIASTGIYLFTGSFFILRYTNIFNFVSLKNSTSFKNVIIAAIVFLSPVIILKQFAPDQSAQGYQLSLLLSIISFSFQRPLIFLVSHVVYFGPMVIYLLFYWKHVCKSLAQEGMGLVLIGLGGLIMSIGSESRMLVFVFPMLAAFAAKAISENYFVSKKHLFFLTILSLLFSKCWLFINTQPLEGSFFEFPFQNYFMHFGPWMSNLMYIVQGSFVLLAILLIYLLFVKDNVHISAPINPEV